MRGTRCLAHPLPIFFRMTLVNADAGPCQQILIRSVRCIEIAHHSWSRETEPDGSSHSSHPCRRLPSQSPTWPSTSGEEKKWAQREAFFNKKMPSRGWVRDFQKHMLDQVTFNQHTIGPSLTLAIPKIKQWICILSNKHKVMVFQICKLHPILLLLPPSDWCGSRQLPMYERPSAQLCPWCTNRLPVCNDWW